MNMMDSLGWEFVDVVLAEVLGARSASHDTPVGSGRIHFKSLFFEQPAIENRADEPRIGGTAGGMAGSSTSTAPGLGTGGGRPEVVGAVALGYNSMLVFGGAFFVEALSKPSSARPGSVSLGCASRQGNRAGHAAPCGRVAAANPGHALAQRCRFPIQHQGNPQ
jgi:hypothetical protein